LAGDELRGPDKLLGLPDCGELERLIREVRRIHEAEVSRRSTGEAERRGGVIVYSEPPAPLVVVGDIHGDVSTLRRILLKIWRIIDKATIIFLGDYIDRGTPEGQASALAAVLRLKLAAPERVILLRGNHEPPPGLEPSPHDYPIALLKLCRGEAGRLYEESRRLFDTMPHAVLMKGWALLLHGGVPTSTLREDLEPEEILAHDGSGEPLVEILWNDPSDNVGWREPNPYRGIGYLWGPKATARAMELLRVRFIIRGHEPALRGFKLNHEVAGNRRVVTLFSRTGPPYGNETAAFLHCPEKPSEANTLSCIRMVAGHF
jgi:protein phosphatase